MKTSKFDVTKNYFSLPNLIFAMELSAGAFAVYSYLVYCEDRKTYQCYPSYRTIGEAVDMSKNTVKKYVHFLENRNLISTEHTKVHLQNGRTQNGNLLYTILPIQTAYEQHIERKIAMLNENAKRGRLKQK